MSASRARPLPGHSLRSRATRLWLASQEHASELVLLAGLEDGEHLVARLELRRSDGDLGVAVAHDGDEPRTVGQLQRLDALARRRRVTVDLYLDDLEVLLAELQQMDDLVLR